MLATFQFIHKLCVVLLCIKVYGLEQLGDDYFIAFLHLAGSAENLYRATAAVRALVRLHMAQPASTQAEIP